MNAYGYIHVHSDFSLKDGAAKIHSICAHAKKEGAKGLTLTDHGNCAGWVEFLQECEANGLQAGPGIEAYYAFDLGDYLTPVSMADNGTTSKRDLAPIRHAHLLLFAKTYDGYREISHLVTAAQEHCENIGGIPQPIVSKALLKEHIKGGNVFITSACILGPLAAIYYCNDPIYKKIKEKTGYMQKYSDFDTDRYGALIAEETDVLSRLAELDKEQDILKPLAKKPPKTREKGIHALKKAYEKEKKKLGEVTPDEDGQVFWSELYKGAMDDAEEKTEAARTAYEEALRAYEADIAAAEENAEKLDAVKREINRLKARKKKIIEEKRPNKEKWAKREQFRCDIETLEANLLTEEERMEALRGELVWLKTQFGSDFYIELQYHGLPREAEFMPLLARLAKEYGVPVVAANDSHLVKKSDAGIRQTLTSLRMGSWRSAEPSDLELYMKSDAELADALGKILPQETVTEAMENVRYIIDNCNVHIPKTTHYPKYRDKDGRELSDTEAIDFLKQLAEDGIPKKFKDGEFTDIYRKRLAYEMDIVTSMGFAHYFLIVWDYVNYAKSLGTYEVGPGRGSGAASLILYLLNVTALDPIKYKLIFERFLNPERKSMPDIDVDFSEAVRGPTIAREREIYGERLVSRIRTVMNIEAKECIRSAARVIGYRECPIEKGFTREQKDKAAEGRKDIYRLGGAIVKEVPDDIKSIRDCKEHLYSLFTDPLSRDILDTAIPLEGKASSFGMHAGGVVISDGAPIDDYIPLMRTGTKKKDSVNDEDSMYSEEDRTLDADDGQLSTACDMIQLEGFVKLLKFDFLGLNTLNQLSETARRVYKNHGIKLDLNALPFEREIFRKIYATGDTGNVFQVESPGMRSTLIRFGPETFEDVILLIAAYRPGPMEFIPKIIDVKKGKATPHYIIPELEDILSITYGYPIYQEQLMDIFHICAGFTLGEADNIRRAMSKKKEKEFLKHKPKFIEGIMAKGASEKDATELWDSLLGFARYGFNKAHAALYALVSYATAYLKYHYPVEYMTSVMNWPANKDSIPKCLTFCREMQIQVLPPDINRSSTTFEDVDGKILYGMGRIRDTEQQAIDTILAARSEKFFTSFKDFIIRGTKTSKTVLRLIESGAFDKLGDISRKDMENALPDLLAFKIKYLDAVKKGKEEEAAKALRDISSYRFTEEKDDIQVKLNKEHNALGSYISAHPMDGYPRIYTNGTRKTAQARAGYGTYAGVITNVVVKRKQDGMQYAKFMLEDKTGMISCIAFVREFQSFQDLIKDGEIVRIEGDIKSERRNDEETESLSLIIRKVTRCEKDIPFLFVSVPRMQFFRMYVFPFIKEYRTEKGHELVIYELETGELVPTGIKMKKDVMWLPIPGVEIKISRR